MNLNPRPPMTDTSETKMDEITERAIETVEYAVLGANKTRLAGITPVMARNALRSRIRQLQEEARKEGQATGNHPPNMIASADPNERPPLV